MSTAEQTTASSSASKDAIRATFPGPHKTIAAALVAAQLNAKAVEKDATNEWHKYAYASAEAVIAEARYALNLAGLATIMERWELLPPVEGGTHRRVKVFFKTIHADSDGVLQGDVEYDAIPEKGRPEDKAVAGALTYAESYYLRGLLCLPRVAAGEEPDRRDDTRYDPNQRRQSQQRPNGRPRNNEQRGGQQSSATTNGGQANGQSSSKAAAPQSDPTNSAPAGNGSAHSERYTWWVKKIVGNLPPSQLRAMSAAIKKDSMIADDTERSALVEMAEKEASSREQAVERAGNPPQ